ncbi:MAG: DUF11 domain-containing protein [Terriglobales bacterium]
MLKRLCVALLVVMALVFSTPAHAQGQTIRTVSVNDNLLRTVNPITSGTVSSVAITDSGMAVTFNSGHGLAVQPGTGNLYALLGTTGVCTRRLAIVNPATGSATIIGTVDDAGANGHQFTALAFDDTGNTLYGLTDNDDPVGPPVCTFPNESSLFTINLATGTATFVVALSSGDGGGLAFNPADGLLYHRYSDGLNTFLETVDPANPLTPPVQINLSGSIPGRALTHWAASFFLTGTNAGGDLILLNSNGFGRRMSPSAFDLDHDVRGIAIVGTPADCTAAGQICGAANDGPNGPSIFYSIDAASGAASMVGPVLFERVSGMAFRPSDGALFAAGETMDGNNTPVLIRITDPTTGLGTQVGTGTGLGGVPFDISFRHSDETLFAYENGGPRVSTIDTATGVGTIGPTASPNGGAGNGFAFDFADTLFASNEVELNIVDPATAGVTFVGASTFAAPLDNFPRVNAMDFHPITGVLFGHGVDDDNDSELVTIDPASGAVTNVGPTQIGLDAIAILPQPADVSITKVDDVDPVLVGDPVTYTVTVTNNGPAIAGGIVLTDTFTGAVLTQIGSSSPTQGSCDDSVFPTISCNLGSLAPAASAMVTIQVSSTFQDLITNTATAGFANDLDFSNNTAIETTDAVVAADLTVTKVDDADPVAVNATVTYTLVVTNAGGLQADNVTLSDTFSGATTGNANAMTTQGTCNVAGFPMITCDLGTLAAAAFATITITVQAQAAGIITNTASVTTSSLEPNTANNMDVETTAVGSADVAMISKTDSADPVNAGSNFTYTISVVNNGPDQADNVTVTDTLPAGVTYVSDTGGCNTVALPTIACNLGSLAVTASAMFNVTVTAGAGGQTVNNTASVTSSQADPDNTNNSASQTTTIVDANLAVNKLATPEPVLVGTNLTYTITITNNGPDGATNVVLNETLDAAVAFVSALASQGACDTSALPAITCMLGNLANAAQATVTIVVTAPATAMTVMNNANVTATEFDSNLANNVAVVVSTVVDVQANVSITKTDAPDPQGVGGNITYTVLVANAGPDAATNVTLTDMLGGAATTFVSVTSTGNTCSGFPTITCTMGTIASGASETVTIVVTATAAGTVINTASSTATENDPTPANNTNIVQNTTVQAPGFTISAAPSSVTLLPGQSATFTVTVTPAPFVAMVDLACSGAPPLGTCSFNPATVNPGNLPASSILTVTTTGFFTAQHRAPKGPAPLYAYFLPASAGFGTMGLVLVNARRRRWSQKRHAPVLALLSLLVLASLIAGCAFGRDRQAEGTPAGTYSLTITVTGGGATQTVPVNVVVQGSN